jgi:hypothetical protein
MSELFEKKDEFLLKEIGAAKGEIKTREDLKRFRFKCPICKQIKSADKIVVLETPMEISQKSDGVKVSAEITCRMLVVCNECAMKLPQKREG